MAGTFINLIALVIAGWLGGNSAGRLFTNLSLGSAGDSVAGVVGGLVGGQAVQMLMPAVDSAAGGLDFAAILGQLVAGAIGGGLLTMIVGFVRNIIDPTHHHA